MKRRIVLALAVGTVLGGVGLRAATGAGGRTSTRTDKEAVEKYFEALGPLLEAHWVTSRDGEADGRALLPSPDFVITAVVRLAPGKAAALAADGGFDAVETGVSLSWSEQALSSFLPAGAAWEHSDAFDEEVLSRFHSGWCCLDRATGTAFVRAINPVGPGQPATATPAPSSS